MKAPNRNTLWAQVFVDELARSGLRAVCIAPGSRSTPLTMAFADCGRIPIYSHIDERSGGFFALGMALASGEPVALVCTSGTATANFHPAVIEAYYAQVPLIVLTADRPHELRDSGANQTIDQVKMYGDHARWFVDVAPPEADPASRTICYLRTLACRALAVATGSPPGPVHLNFPFRKPLEPTPVPGDVPDHLWAETPEALRGRAHGAPFTHITRGMLSPSAEQIDTLVDAIRGASRGFIVCGPRCPPNTFPWALAGLARASGYPVLADALSGVRFGPHVDPGEGLIHGGYETFLQACTEPRRSACTEPRRSSDAGVTWEPPQLVLRFGAMPTSKALGDYLESLPGCRQIAVDESGVWKDATHGISDFIWADPETTCRLVADRLEAAQAPPADPRWVAAIRRAEGECWEAIDAALEEVFFEGVILADVAELLQSGAVLYVSNSLPVRHLDQFARPRPAPLRVLANRGASGIDGTVSSALGAAAATDAPLLLVTGDLAFYHDLNGLLALRRCGVKATIVLINNDGGGIFHRLPIANFDPPFTELFVTPHGLDFEPVERVFGMDYVRVTTRKAFRRTVQESIGAAMPRLIEVPSDPVQHERYRREIVDVVARRVAAKA